MVTVKYYHSTKKSYHQIRYQSDKLCNENKQSKKSNSWKSRLQFDIDHMIKLSKDWGEFLKKIAELSYEIKHGKHIAFKPNVNVNIRMYNFDDIKCTITPSFAYDDVICKSLQLC